MRIQVQGQALAQRVVTDTVFVENSCFAATWNAKLFVLHTAMSDENVIGSGVAQASSLVVPRQVPAAIPMRQGQRGGHRLLSSAFVR